MRVRPLSRPEAMAFLTTRLRQVRAAERLAAERGELADVERERLGATAVAGRRRVHAGEGRVYLVDTVFLVEAPDRASLRERLELLRLEARGADIDLEPATFRLADAWSAVLPGPAPRPIAERNLDSASLAASLLHAASDLYEPSGHLYGIARRTEAPIVLDRFGHASHNAIVLGQTGTGKTMFTGAEMGRCFLRGIRVLAVDPLGDYRRLTGELGGTYLELGAGAGLNPFALTGATGDVGLTAKLSRLTRLVAAMVGGLSRDERPVLDRALRAVYQEAGIGPDPATHDRTPPTIADLATRIEAEPGGRALAGRLERWASGSLAQLFAAEGAPPLDRRMLVIGLAAISDPEVRSVAQLAALGVLWDAVRRDLERKLVVVDEAWKVMRQPSGAEFVEELARSARHYHAGLQLATQDIVEFLRSDFGEPIVKQCDIRVLFGQTPEGADALARYFDLTAAERRLAAPRPPRRGPPLRRAQPHRLRGGRRRARVRRAHHPSGRPGRSLPSDEVCTPRYRVRRGCGCGCAVALVVLLILTGSVAVLVGNWAALAAPAIADAPPAVADIPADYLVLYEEAGARFGLDWPVLAAVGKVETNHGRNANGCAPNSAGARGPMQFLPATFAHAAKLAGITDPDICDPADAIPAAAAYLKSNGAPDDWQRALYRYNPVDWYPPLVMSWAQRYGYGALLVWPLDGPITQGFGPTDLALEPPRCYEGHCYPHFHTGIDIAAPLGTPVRAIAAGQSSPSPGAWPTARSWSRSSTSPTSSACTATCSPSSRSTSASRSSPASSSARSA